MKKGNFLLTALALLLAVSVSASKIPTLNVIAIENNKALVAFENSKPTAVEVTVKSKKGEILYYKKSEVPVEDLRLVLDFQNLENGNYDVKLDFNNFTINREITIANSTITRVGEAERAFGPYYQFEDNLLKVSFLNNNQNSVLMDIYKEGKHVTTKRLGKEMCIQRVFDFSKLEAGQYDIRLTDNKHDYQFVVNR